MNSGRRLPQSVLPITLSAVACLALVLWFASDSAEGFAGRLVGYLGLAGLGLYAAVCSALAARSTGGTKLTAWTTMAFALAAWTAGELVRALYDLALRRPPSPSPADIFYLAFFVLVCVAFVQFPRTPTTRSSARLLFDALILALSLFLLLWAVLLDGVNLASRGNSTQVGLALLYPLPDLIVVTVAILVATRAGFGRGIVMWLLVGAVALMAVSDVDFAYLVTTTGYQVGDASSVGWALSLACFAAAALLGRESPRSAPSMDGARLYSSVWVTYLPLLLAGIVGPLIVLTGLLRIGVPTLMTLLYVRQVIAARENQRLFAAAADRALRDPLTGLANRTLFQYRLANAMALRRPDDRAVAVISLDLDDFKLINDSLGHPAADSLLVQVGERIAACLRPGGTVARLGGDEFALLHEGPVDHAYLLSERVIEAFDKPFVIGGQEIVVHPSIGMAVAPAGADLAPEDLVTRADIAMYTAKRSHNSAVHTFSSDMTLLDPDAVDLTNRREGRPAGDGAAQVRLLGELRRAIDRGAVDLVYQPKVELRTGRIVGVEALLRWPHPRLGVLRPATFLPLVHQHGLMRPVTSLVLNKAVDDAARWASLGVAVPVAVNLFAPLLRDPRLPDMVHRALDEHGLPSNDLTIEITEDLVLSEVESVAAVLRRLRDDGIRVAIDDFGSGYSALSYLRDLPIDEVKLDRHFITSATRDARAAAVVRAVIELTHDLEVTVVAEGVEDDETASWLSRHGCDIGQGYHFGPPVSATEVPELIAANAGQR